MDLHWRTNRKVRKIIVTVSYKIVKRELLLIIVIGNGLSLFGHDWLPFDWKEIAFIQAEALKSLIILMFSLQI